MALFVHVTLPPTCDDVDEVSASHTQLVENMDPSGGSIKSHIGVSAETPVAGAGKNDEGTEPCASHEPPHALE